MRRREKRNKIKIIKEQNKTKLSLRIYLFFLSSVYKKKTAFFMSLASG